MENDMPTWQEELNRLIGMNNVKNKVNELKAIFEDQIERDDL